jgi:threonine synthase
MDIQVASNFERYLYYLLDGNPERVRSEMTEFGKSGVLTVEMSGGGGVDRFFSAVACDTEATVRTIGEFYANYNYLLDPHTAAGVFAAGRVAPSDSPTICLATAHPAKFAEVVTRAVGKDVARHPVIDALAGKPTRLDVLPASVAGVQAYIEERIVP